MKLTKDTRLCILNSRIGSRLTFNPNFRRRAIETGNLGIDIDYKKKGVYHKQSLKQLRFYVQAGHSEKEGFYFSDLDSYFGMQELDIGCTDIILRGTQSSQLDIKLTIKSPISEVKSLSDDESLKIGHTPHFYIDIEVTNRSSYTQKTKIFVGFDFKKKLRANESNIIFLDEGKNALSKSETKIGLRNIGSELFIFNGDEEEGFCGFLLEKEMNSEELIKGHFIYAGFVEEDVFVNKIDTERPKLMKFYYTKWFESIDQVLDYAETHREKNIRKNEQFEKRLCPSFLSDREKQVIALAFRTYMANTWLLADKDGNAEFYVGQGNFGIISPLDVGMETAIIAILFPWMLKLQLLEWKRYLTVSDETGYFYLKNDMGYDQEAGYSFYEEKGKKKLKKIVKSASPKPVENNCNFMILLAFYYYLTEDKQTLEEMYATVFKLALANKKRGFRNTGIAETDLCTTYDVMGALHKPSLNTYLALKELVSYLFCRDLSNELGENKNGDILLQEALKIADAVEYYLSKVDFIPISLDRDTKENQMMTIVPLEPLFYPTFMKYSDPVLSRVIPLLKEKFDKTLFECTKIYGVRFTPNEKVIWFSKLSSIEAVAKKLLSEPMNTIETVYIRNISNEHAYMDGIISEEKDWNDARSPRGIIWLWKSLFPDK